MSFKNRLSKFIFITTLWQVHFGWEFLCTFKPLKTLFNET